MLLFLLAFIFRFCYHERHLKTITFPGNFWILIQLFVYSFFFASCICVCIYACDNTVTKLLLFYKWAPICAFKKNSYFFFMQKIARTANLNLIVDCLSNGLKTLFNSRSCNLLHLPFSFYGLFSLFVSSRTLSCVSMNNNFRRIFSFISCDRCSVCTSTFVTKFKNKIRATKSHVKFHGNFHS